MKDKMITVMRRLCQYYGKQEWWQSQNPVEDLLAMILIQRTTEQNARLALQKLQDSLSLEALVAMKTEELQSRIRSAGFFKQKAKTIQEVARYLLEQGGFEVVSQYSTNELRQCLLDLNGIGFETADVMLLYLFQRPVFIADEYARRLFARLNLGDYQRYEDMKQEIQPIVEQISVGELKEWHAVIDEHGKNFRRSKGQIDEAWLLE